MQARQIARELALLSLSQFSKSPAAKDTPLQDMLLAAVRVLSGEAQDLLSTASSELSQSGDRLFSLEVDAVTLESTKTIVQEASELTRKAINRTARALELPEMLQMTNQQEVQAYALQIGRCVKNHQEAIDEALGSSMVNWRLGRLPRVDQDILRIAVAEIQFLGLPHKVAIDEAVELAKRYSDDEGKRFINGVLRRVVDAGKNPQVSGASS
jgi:transcription antitermination protein NusB